MSFKLKKTQAKKLYMIYAYYRHHKAGFENKPCSILALCKTKDAVLGSELFIAHRVTENRFAVYYNQIHCVSKKKSPTFLTVT